MEPTQLVAPAPKRKKKSKFLSWVGFILVACSVQFLLFYGLDKFLDKSDSIDVEPTKTVQVESRQLTLKPMPDQPNLLTISPDRTSLVLVDHKQLKIYNLRTGQQIKKQTLAAAPVALQWLPDRNRLIYAVIREKITRDQIVEESTPPPTGKKDETYSTETYRKPKTITRSGFEIQLYSLDAQTGAKPELFKTLKQSGEPPKTINLNMSTYTNLLYLNWEQSKQDYLVQIDIMKRVKDYRLPRGRLTKLVVVPTTGELYGEFSKQNDVAIYKYGTSSWKLQRNLDGYRLIGVTPDDQLAVSPDRGGLIRKVMLLQANGEFKPGWAFTTPLKLDQLAILNDGRLIYFGQGQVIIHTPQLGTGTVYPITQPDAYSADGKMVASWQDNQLIIMEEVEKKAN